MFEASKIHRMIVSSEVTELRGSDYDDGFIITTILWYWEVLVL